MDSADVAFILKFIISVTLCLKRNGGQCPHRRPWPGRKIREIILNQLLFSPLNRNFLLVTLTGNHCCAPEFLECTLVCTPRRCTMGLHQGVTGVTCQGEKFPVSSRFYKKQEWTFSGEWAKRADLAQFPSLLFFLIAFWGNVPHPACYAISLDGEK